MTGVVPFRTRQQIRARHNLAAFIRSSRKLFMQSPASANVQWKDSVWPRIRWVKLAVGKRRRFAMSQRLDPRFSGFAKAYVVWLRTHRPTKSTWSQSALRCIEQALLICTGSGSIQGLSHVVLDEAAVAAGAHFTPQARYHVGRHIRLIAEFVTDRRLVPAQLSTWKSPFRRPPSTRRTGPADRDGIRTKMPSDSALYAMAEIFANDLPDVPARFASAVWALLMCAPWRISELLRLHVDAEYVASDDSGVVSYGFRYYGSKGFAHDIKWISKTMEPVAREAFRRLREMTESARVLARHIESDSATPFLYAEAPAVGYDDVLSLDQKAAYLRRPAPKNTVPSRPGWSFRSIREHWDSACQRLPKAFPVFDVTTGLKWSQALFCFHRNALHEIRPVDWYGLIAPTANTVNDLFGASAVKEGVFSRLGYKDSSGRPLCLTTHQARHYVSTLAERGAMAQEDLAKWAGRATLSDNRVYNHMSESELVERSRDVFAGPGLVPSNPAPPTFFPTTPAEYNTRERGPTHRTEFGVCEHDWVMSPCMKHRDCLNCSEHVCRKGDAQAHATIRERHAHHLDECTKALDAVLSGTALVDRWLEHALKSLVREHQLLCLMESDAIEDGAPIRLSDGRAEHSHLGRALEKKLPALRDRVLPQTITDIIRRYINGESLVDATRRIDHRSD